MPQGRAILSTPRQNPHPSLVSGRLLGKIGKGGCNIAKGLSRTEVILGIESIYRIKVTIEIVQIYVFYKIDALLEAFLVYRPIEKSS
jgi:hypothetical protein